MLKKKQPIEELVALSFSFITIPAVIIISFCLFYSHQIMNMLYHGHVEESAAVLQLVMSCFLAISSVYIFGTLLTANGNLKQLNKVALSGMVLNIVLNLYLIPRLEARGAAISSIITQYLTAGMQVFLAHKIFKFRFHWMLLLRYLLFAGSTLYLFYMSTTWGTDWLLTGIIASCASVLMALGLFLIKPISLVRLIRAGEA